MSEISNQPETVFFNDRYVNRQVRWWIQNGGIPKGDLFCVHSVKLDEYCDECVEERLKPK
jgi:hypothetical protein